MSSQIVWQIFLQVKSQEKADRLLGSFAAALGRDLRTLGCERYWKDDKLFKARASTPLRAEDCSGALLETLELCWRVARNWNVGAPQHYEGDRWEVQGVAAANAIGIPGVAFVDFQASNFAADEPVSNEVATNTAGER